MAAKIKDGLFIGDEETSQSEVFINDNKISNLVNLSGREVKNVWASHGLVYLTYYWEDRPDFKLLSNHEDNLLTDIMEFIDVSINHGISVLLFSKNGTGRCVVAACLYLMVKYGWGFEKTYDYVYSKKPDVDLNRGFIQQMFALDMKLLASRQKALARKLGKENSFRIEANMTIKDIAAMLDENEGKRWSSWDKSYVEDYKNQIKKRTNNPLNHIAADVEEEIVLICSFLNSKNTITSLPGPYRNAYDTHKAFKLRFNQNLCEESTYMLRKAPIDSRTVCMKNIRGIMKGSRLKFKQRISEQPERTEFSPTADAKGAKKSEEILENDKYSARMSESKSDIAVPGEKNEMKNSYSFRSGDRIMYSSYTKDDSKRGEIINDSINNPTKSLQENADLYGYVGIDNERKSGGSAIFENRGGLVDDFISSTPATIVSNQGTSQPLSAEERLRNLMESMQKQTHATKVSNNYTSTINGRPSLYELANMDVQSQHHSSRYEIKGNNTRNEPFPAFGTQQHSSRPSSGRAIRARHDIKNGNFSMRQSQDRGSDVPAVRQAWVDPNNLGRAPSPNVHKQNKISSTRVTSGRSGDSGSNNVRTVGSGTGSGSRVYR